jgi:hypothetical protein
VSTLSRGDLDLDVPTGKMNILQWFKNIHMNLRHLDWKTQQIAGDERLLSAMAEGQALNLDDSVESLVRKVITWRGKDHLGDDVSILAIEVV